MDPQFTIEASAAESMAETLNHPSVLHLLPHLVNSAKSLARPPISNYPVAAVGLGSDGRIFIGVNLEFPGLPLHHSVHAEQFLLNNLALHRCPQLLAVAVSSAPCGHCRQFFQELRHSASVQILVLDGEKHSGGSFTPLSSFLPNPFGPRDLLHEDTPLLLEPHDNGLSPEETHSPELLCNGNCAAPENGDSLLWKAALEAANAAHAPYTGCPSGVALMDSEGKVYKGSYVESAAYNPSFGPVQAALVAYVAAGGGGYERIVAGALVEKEGAKVRQEDTARILLNAVSPHCIFRAFTVPISSKS